MEMEEKTWQDLVDEGALVEVKEQEAQLDLISNYNKKFDKLIENVFVHHGATDYIVKPNIDIIKEYNTSFIELMRNHSHKYGVKRIVPIQIERALIDVGAAFEGYIVSPDKKRYVEEYHKGSKFTKIDKGCSLTSYIAELNKQYTFVLDLYKQCCDYVHANYLQAKATSAFDYPIKIGRIGFMGKYYKLKYEDFINELLDGFVTHENMPFDYEEEVDIIKYCIQVNDMLLDLAEQVRNIDSKP